MSNRTFFFFIVTLLLLGLYLGWFLSIRPTFSVPGILNVVGIIYSMIAVLVLYETVAQSQAFKKVIVSYIAPSVLWAHTVIPLGVAVSWLFIFKYPNGNKIAAFGFVFFLYSILPLAFLDATVTFPKTSKMTSIDGRHRRFGLFLLLSGLAMQLIASLYTL